MNQVSPPRRNSLERQPQHERYADRGFGYDGPYNDRYHEDRDYHDRYPEDLDHDTDYPDERYSRAPRPQRPRARSWDSYDSRDSQREDAERRSSRTDAQRSQAKSSSKLSTTFDKSQRGLGYGAVGAIAGGLVGSEIGKGPVPAAIGAVLGGLGANMFEAREK